MTIETVFTLKTLRQSRDLKRKDVAKAIRVSPTAVEDWELGKYKPKYQKVIALAKLYKVPEEDLFDLIYHSK